MTSMLKRQLELADIQKLSLGILKDVHDFCMSHGITYSLAYGTMLGAVRHKGFIPWDDDIDIVMPRPDYERFKKSFKSQCGNALVTEQESYIAFSRVCDTRHTVASKSLWPWMSNPNMGGVDRHLPFGCNRSRQRGLFMQNEKVGWVV